MKALWALVKVGFKSLLLTTMNVGRRGKKANARTGVGAFIFLSVLMLFLSATYSFMMAAVFAPMGGLDLMLYGITVLACVFPFIFILFASQSLVFSTKDIDLVFSLPVSSFSVILSRVMALYLEALLMVEMVLIPMAAAYLVFGGLGVGAGIAFFVRVLLQGVFLSLLPTTVALVFGAVISILISRLPFKSFFTVLFTLLLLLVIMVGSFALSYTVNTVDAATFDLAGLQGILSQAMPPLNWAVQGMLGNVGYFLLVVGLCVVPFLFFTWLFSLMYKKLLTLLSSHRLKSNYKLGRLKSSGAFTALFKKEAKKFFGTPALLLNAGIGVILVIIGSVAALFNKNAIAGVVGEIVDMGGDEVLPYIAPMLLITVIFFTSLTFISCVSISLEGKTLWILKEAPLSVGRIFAAKAGFNFLISAISAVICIPLLGAAFGLPPLQVLCMAAVCLAAAYFISVAGLYINLLFPRMDAENETIVIKQSASVVVTMLVAFVMVGLLVGLYFLLGAAGLGFSASAAVAALVLAALGAGVTALLNTSGRQRFAQLT